MNILLINDFKTGGGAEVIFYKTYQTLMAIGHNVDIVYCHEKIVSPKSIITRQCEKDIKKAHQII